MFTLNCKGKLLSLEKPLVMGIINVTPDSFYGGSRFESGDLILQAAEKMLNEGASILDIGGQSTRPGSTELTAAEEIQRVIPAIHVIHERFPEAILSVDSFYASIAEEAVAAGASIINDISAGERDAGMIPFAAAAGTPFICMHMKGKPVNMQHQAQYEDVTREVLDFFIQKKQQCMEAGIRDLVMDPGLGFAKTIAHNFELLRNLPVFQMIGCPLLVGVSRKSTVYKSLGISATDALNGTTVLNTVALLNGAAIIRVHDVKEAVEAITLLQALGK